MSEPALSQVPAANFAQRLEELLQRGDPEGFLREVAAHSDLAADSHPEVLAIVDQLYRRRKLSPQLFRLARIGIERRALGFHEPAGAVGNVPADRRAAAQPQSLSQPEPRLQIEPGSQHEVQPRTEAVSAGRELERMRAELARAQIEAAAQRERAQRLERQLGQQSQKQQKPPAAPVARPTQPLRAGRVRWLWLIGAGGALTALALALALVLRLPGVRHGAAPPSAVVATGSAPTTAVRPVTSPGSAMPAAPSGELTFEADRYVVGPVDHQVVITVRRSAGRAGEVAVEWRASGGAAQSGRDFLVPAPATLMLRDQQDAAQITIPILRNPSRKHTEYFDLRLVRVTGGASLGPQRRTTVFLLPGAGGPRPEATPRTGN